MFKTWRRLQVDGATLTVENVSFNGGVSGICAFGGSRCVISIHKTLFQEAKKCHIKHAHCILFTCYCHLFTYVVVILNAEPSMPTSFPLPLIASCSVLGDGCKFSGQVIVFVWLCLHRFSLFLCGFLLDFNCCHRHHRHQFHENHHYHLKHSNPLHRHQHRRPTSRMFTMFQY